MRGAFGKPQGTVARVDIGQIIVSVRGRDQHKANIVEALRRAKFKFPGRQKVYTLRVCVKCVLLPSPPVVTFSHSYVYSYWNKFLFFVNIFCECMMRIYWE